VTEFAVTQSRRWIPWSLTERNGFHGAAVQVPVVMISRPLTRLALLAAVVSISPSDINVCAN